MFRVFAAFTAIALLAQICVASAGDYGTRDEAVAMVKRVEDMFAKAGPDSTFKAVSDKSLATFHDRDLYPFIYDLSGRCVAHGARPALIGKNLLAGPVSMSSPLGGTSTTPKPWPKWPRTTL
jgi:hypothetical protein